MSKDTERMWGLWKKETFVPWQRAPMQIEQSRFSIDSLATDLIGKLPVTDSGSRYILVVSGYFTRRTEWFAVKEVIVRLGVPYTIHTDQGRQYKRYLCKEVCSLLKVEKTHTSPYHPQFDGMVERFNITLEAMLSSCVNQNHTDWDKQIPFLMIAYISAEHDTTWFTLNYHMLGRKATTPSNLAYEMEVQRISIPQNW